MSDEDVEMIESPSDEDAEDSPSDDAIESEVGGEKFDNDYGTIADNSNSMVGPSIHYSKRNFPNREKDKVSDEEDELGLHSDRLSTFSFSSKQPMMKKPQPSPEGSDTDKPAAAEDNGNRALPDVRSDKNPSFGVDNFHDSIHFTKSRTSAPANRPDPAATRDGRTNHADRLSTFSLSTKEDKEDQPSVSPRSAGGSGGSGLPIHDNRLGTFSFASTLLQSGSTGTGSSNPLPSASEPPQTKAESKSTKEWMDSTIDNTVSPNQVYTSPQKGSLSSIASSVSIKSRSERIKEISIANDRSYPDGQDIPRLNRKGDVMSASLGRPNIFQRIDQAKQELKDDDVAAGAEEKDTNSISEVGGMGYDETGNILQKSTDNNKSVGDSLENGDCFIGFDLGTSGARMSIVEKNLSGSDAMGNYEEVFTAALAWDDKMQYDDAHSWRAAIDTLLLRAQGTEAMPRVKAICVSGTSATCLLVNRHSLDVSRAARMYNYDIISSSDSADESPADRVMKLIDQYVPEKHTARATTGSLAKLLLWNEEQSLVDEIGETKEALCHQSDYVSMSLMHEGLKNVEKCTVTSDWHNCLKLGYDVRRREFPSWMHTLLKEGANIPDPESILPSKVISPGEPFGVISPIVASKYGLSTSVVLVGGTTDSNAAFFAAAGAKPAYGTAVTSLGSTLAIKQLSKTFVEDASRGVYSHRFPRFASDGGGEGEEDEAWLIGGASNVGCAILRQEGFSNKELTKLSAKIDADSDSPLSYYPLTKKGERFPVADSAKEPVLKPKPKSRKEYLHGILQGIGDVERDGFRILGELGASPDRPKIVLSCGGGSKNDMWISMRERRLKDICDEDKPVEVKRAQNTEASYGAALLAAASFEN